MIASETVEDTRALVHRIRNDLQLVSSIIHAEMSVASTDEARAALSAMDRRMLAINLSYAGAEATHVHLPRYLRDLCQALGHSLGDCPDRSIGSVAARRLGMIAAEALGSANRAAEVRLVSRENALHVDVTREKAEAARGTAVMADPWMTGISRELVVDLLRQLGGHIIVDDATVLSFAIPDPPAAAAPGH